MKKSLIFIFLMCVLVAPVVGNNCDITETGYYGDDDKVHAIEKKTDKLIVKARRSWWDPYEEDPSAIDDEIYWKAMDDLIPILSRYPCRELYESYIMLNLAVGYQNRKKVGFERAGRGHFERALEIYEEMMREDPLGTDKFWRKDKNDPLFDIAAGYDWLASHAEDSGDYEQAISELNKAILLFHRGMRVMKRRGAKIVKGEARVFEKTYGSVFKVKFLYNDRGDAKYQLDDYEGAISDYSRAIELDPKDAVVYDNRGDAKYRLGKKAASDHDRTKLFKGAISDHNRAIALDPEYARAYNNRGHANYRLGYYESAIEDYSRAIELDPKDPIHYSNRGNTKYEWSKKAASDYDRTKLFKGAMSDAKMYFQLAYNKWCAKGGSKISVDGSFGPQTRKALKIAKAASPDSECHKNVFHPAYKKDLLEVMEKSSQ